MSGKLLDPDLVITARAEEIEETRRGSLYEKVPISECWKESDKAPITTRWVDINKGDSVHPEYRSRIVAREMKKQDIFRDDLFAATPPLEAKKMLFSLAMCDEIAYD